MKNIKRFEIDVLTAIGSEVEYDGEDYPLQVVDLNTDYASASDGSVVAEIEIYGEGNDTAKFTLGLEEIDSLFDVLTHIKEKVLATKKPEKDEPKL